jgi:hypothetical protein
MRKLLHENLCSCVSQHEDEKHLYIVMELADEDLSNMILKQKLLNKRNKDSFFDESFVLKVLF